jgi:hypothetical protein
MEEEEVQNGKWELQAEILKNQAVIREMKAQTDAENAARDEYIKRTLYAICVAVGADHEGKVDAVLTKEERVAAEIEKMFDRYDLDGSGTINTSEELKQLVYNLAFKLELSKPEVEKCLIAMPEMTEENAMDEVTFTKWFNETVLVRASMERC